MPWSTPKTNWAAGDSPRNTDFNRIEENTFVLNQEKVPYTRTINGKSLVGNITLTNADIGAAATTHNHSVAQITTTGTLPVKVVAQSNTEYAARQIRNVVMVANGAGWPSTSSGDIIHVYA